MIIDYSLQVPTFLLRTECQNKVDGPGETPWVMPKKLGPSKLTDKSQNYFLFHNSFLVI